MSAVHLWSIAPQGPCLPEDVRHAPGCTAYEAWIHSCHPLHFSQVRVAVLQFDYREPSPHQTLIRNRKTNEFRQP